LFVFEEPGANRLVRFGVPVASECLMIQSPGRRTPCRAANARRSATTDCVAGKPDSCSAFTVRAVSQTGEKHGLQAQRVFVFDLQLLHLRDAVGDEVNCRSRNRWCGATSRNSPSPGRSRRDRRACDRVRSPSVRTCAMRTGARAGRDAGDEGNFRIEFHARKKLRHVNVPSSRVGRYSGRPKVRRSASRR